MASRLCAPACCSGLESVPPCCPCNCFAQLDLPFYMWFVCMLVLGATDMVLAMEHVGVLRIARLAKIVALALLIAAIICSVIKLCIMCGCCCQEQLPHSNAPTKVQETPVVVGQPVSVEQKVVGDPVVCCAWSRCTSFGTYLCPSALQKRLCPHPERC